MRPFSMVIGASAFFIAGCAAYFSVRGIALTFGAVSAFTIPIMLMASSLEIGKLVAASFLYRHWHTCNSQLRFYLSLAVVLLIGITSAGIYGYLSQAFEETLSQVEGFEKEISSLQRQQNEFDRLIQAYQTSGQRGSALREEKQGEERARLEKYIEERRKDILSAEESKGRLAEETDQMIVGERQKREEEKKRLQEEITLRRNDISKLEEDRKSAKVENDERIEKELEKEKVINQRIAELDAAVKAYRDQGPGGFLKEDGFKKAAELLKSQKEEREALRASLSEINAAIQKARDDLNQRYTSLDARIESIQKEISDANQKITVLTTGGSDQADRVRTALENLKQARASVDQRIQSLEAEIAEASKKITSMSEMSSAFGPDSSAELEEKKSELQTKKEQAEQRILELEGKIRSTDIGSFKFVARAFDPEVTAAEKSEDPIRIAEAMDRAVHRVVKWFILILVVVFDPLAVALVVAFNASLLRKSGIGENNPSGAEKEINSQEKKGKGSGVLFFFGVGLLLFLIYEIIPDSGDQKNKKAGSKSVSLLTELIGDRVDDRALAYVPQQAFGVCSFSTLRMVEEVGMPKIISNELLARVPFLEDMVWDPVECGVQPNGRALYFTQLPTEMNRVERTGDVLFGLILPIGNEDKVKNFIIGELDLKSQNPNWKVLQNQSPIFHSIHHEKAHVSIGLDANCLVLLSSWWTDRPDPNFLDEEMRSIFQNGQNSNSLNPRFASKLRADDYDVALFLFGENFFNPFQKSSGEEGLLQTFRDFLSFNLSLKAKSGLDGVSLFGEYDYQEEVLDAGFGLRVASLMNKVREDENFLNETSVFAEFVEIFLQRLDFQSVVNVLKGIDLSQSTGFEAFRSWDFVSRIQGNRLGTFSVKADSIESGGASLRLTIDLLVESLNPFKEPIN